jgi:CBS domain-containing protein
LHPIEVGPVERIRNAKVCQAGTNAGEPPTVRQTLTLTVTAPEATVKEVMDLMQEGAAVFAVVGTRQHRLGEEPE